MARPRAATPAASDTPAPRRRRAPVRTATGPRTSPHDEAIARSVAHLAAEGCTPTAVQRAVFEALASRAPLLVVAPTGSGKTAAVMLPLFAALAAERDATPAAGTRVLYLTPVRALADGHGATLAAMARAISPRLTVGVRTGDTSSHARTKLKRAPPDVLITTPETLAVMLATDTRDGLAGLREVVLDEVHLLADGKRGALLAATLATLDAFVRRCDNPVPRRLALSATVASPAVLGRWVAPETRVLAVHEGALRPVLDLAEPALPDPYPPGAWTWCTALPTLARRILGAAGATLVFVGSRANAEAWSMALRDVLPARIGVACYHGSLSAEARAAVAAGLADGTLHAVVATSSLEVGVDLPRVTDVLCLGSPPSVTRLLQSAGRADHRPGAAARASLIPRGASDLVRCAAILHAARDGRLEDLDLRAGDLDVAIQAALGRIALGPCTRDDLAATLRAAWPFVHLDDATLDRVLGFLRTGGAALAAYPEMARAVSPDGVHWEIAHPRALRRYLQGVGTIVSEPTVAVLRGTAVIGQLQGRYAALLEPGDRFSLGGRTWRVVGRHPEGLQVRPDKADPRSVPVWDGARAALSPVVAEAVESLWGALDDLVSARAADERTAAIARALDIGAHNAAAVGALVLAQRAASALPRPGRFLVEHLVDGGRAHLVAYTFAGSRANEVIARAMAVRMRAETGYGAEVSALDECACVTFPADVRVDAATARAWLAPDGLARCLAETLDASVLASAYFREVARVSQLLVSDGRKGAVTPGLLHDVLRRHDPGHVLLTARDHTLWTALDGPRAESVLRARAVQPMAFHRLDGPSALAVPVLAWARRDGVMPADPERALADAAHALWQRAQRLEGRA